ncbi:hypothetical protein BDV37DRAFT_242485 [Aspergillus pseudonomiae]|uniref:Uncharacterized protein n=1 Tax=Aspergillus pseudonomiae TaxID=1506151 RepID=A0A5N7DJZ9_9EURO|nr:uncharacterized protein BDV37DRAFT_242485 [Aspergillus pseudonomiae]KAE8406752.1 hypothetical protein BDV37DRAFT_242485 [Aspergillus pseudonomiae]
MAGPAAPLRTILPAVYRSPHKPPIPVHCAERRSKRRSLGLSIAYILKCSGPPPCGACAATNSECCFEPLTDKRRKLTRKAAEKDMESYRHVSMYLISILRSGKEDDVNNLVKEVQKASSLDSALADLQSLVSREKS